MTRPHERVRTGPLSPHGTTAAEAEKGRVDTLDRAGSAGPSATDGGAPGSGAALRMAAPRTQNLPTLAGSVRAVGLAESFDLLYARQARSLYRQTLLLCGHRQLANRAVAHAFRRAWEDWSSVGSGRNPVSWVRAEAYDYALSPWHQLRPGHHQPQAYPGPPGDRARLEAFWSLPSTYRRTLILHDGLRLGLPAVAAETEATETATCHRLDHARQAWGERVPELAAVPPEARGARITTLLARLGAAQPARLPPVERVRPDSERASGWQTWWALVPVLLLVLAALLGTTG